MPAFGPVFLPISTIVWKTLDMWAGSWPVDTYWTVALVALVLGACLWLLLGLTAAAVIVGMLSDTRTRPLLIESADTDKWLT